MKASLLGRMPGDSWQRFANLRLLFCYLYTQPGKKLLFMGAELAQDSEWNFRQALPWHLLDHAQHHGIQRLVCDLNRLYRDHPALHRHDFEAEGFQWLDCDDAEHSVLCYLRKCDEEFVVVALNFTPMPREHYRVGVPRGGGYRELLNSDSSYYGGSNLGNLGHRQAEGVPAMRQPCSLILTLPPLAAVILAPQS